MNVGKLVGTLASASLGAVIVSSFVSAANLSGNAGVIASLFTFLLVGGAGLAIVKNFS